MISATFSLQQPPSPSSLTSPEILQNPRRSSLSTRNRSDGENPRQAIHRLRELLINGREFSDRDFAPAIKACSKAFALRPGMQIHAQSIKRSLSSDVFIQTSLLSMYSSCGQVTLAFQLFDEMPERNVVSWTTMINACIRSEQSANALILFREMQRAGVKPDCFTLVSVLSACAHLGALNLGRWVHVLIDRAGLELTVFVGTALVDMYCKCGNVDDGLNVFNSMVIKSIRTWNAILYGLSVHGRGEEAIELFKEMEREGEVRPNGLTFLGVLCGCSHCGLVEKGRFYFEMMQKKYGIEPTIKHYGCMVDLLGRAGLLDEAFEMITEMPISPNIVVWGALLSACRVQNNVDMAERVSKRMIGIQGDSQDTSHHVILSNIYAEAGFREKMAKERLKIGKKPTGRSWIEIGCDVHEFAAGDVSEGKIREVLVEMMRKVGKDDGREEEIQNPHSEKVAVAFGLLNTSAPAPIRIAKNLRICRDCHGTMKRISEVYVREIIVRDCTRFHRFRGTGKIVPMWIVCHNRIILKLHMER
ncbi:pentatricopeptide repeat-containing protein At1g59720, chloroplastic/mitochondrial-like isoform X2 [Tasmannia lanceolata]|uniref:pentatricopeptide repeat-containing protein At1g59720, chloroplastic/mitochondrial-like isoform X2 n=1 Tax=Tasmannia lanceolata TaxID=3420 RepID=UPI0040639732